VSKGIPRLRRPSADWYRAATTSRSTRPEAIVTIGSKEGLAHLMLATLDRGDTVLVPNPSYPIHIYGAVIAGATSVRCAWCRASTSSPSSRRPSRETATRSPR
jgi:alanine-synthesizing transaminase